MYLSTAKRFVWLLSGLDWGLLTFPFFNWLVLSSNSLKQMLLFGIYGRGDSIRVRTWRRNKGGSAYRYCSVVLFGFFVAVLVFAMFWNWTEGVRYLDNLKFAQNSCHENLDKETWLLEKLWKMGCCLYVLLTWKGRSSNDSQANICFWGEQGTEVLLIQSNAYLISSPY